MTETVENLCDGFPPRHFHLSRSGRPRQEPLYPQPCPTHPLGQISAAFGQSRPKDTSDPVADDESAFFHPRTRQRSQIPVMTSSYIVASTTTKDVSELLAIKLAHSTVSPSTAPLSLPREDAAATHFSRDPATVSTVSCATVQRPLLEHSLHAAPPFAYNRCA